ncbi:hypothetical protein AU255_01995 [Methyloprofundus sedimenti]|uniref:MAM domain-containing protein n=1 Tax=Methyloprofundus sedimenti TaxID=1420851 RepID=A0A1V8M572_9GAMM|nr:M36 family metallopeptidase [Methyloprofundus sedimenti]OQK16702.1 hypothetical protein AU255_01995 [Methyloprofundus sedimenti]
MKNHSVISVPVVKEQIGIILFALLALFFSGVSLGGVRDDTNDRHKLRNFDHRIRHNAGFERKPGPEQVNVQKRLQRMYPELKVRFDKWTGVARTVINPSGHLSEVGADPVGSVQSFLSDNHPLFGLTLDDFSGYQVRNQVFSKFTGATHIYLQQNFEGIPVFNGQFNVSIDRNQRIMIANNDFVSNLRGAVNTIWPRINVRNAIRLAAFNLGVDAPGAIKIQRAKNSQNQLVRANYPTLSQQEITAQLKLLPIRDRETRLVWNIVTYGPDDTDLYEFNIDAVTGEVWTRFDLTNNAQFQVYEQPAESPNHVVSPLTLPPGDGRSFVIDPESITASPSGWFDNSTGIMKGNNVHACINADTNNTCDNSEPTCNVSDPLSFLCDFTINLSAAPSNSRPAAVTNLFYWNNLIHDIHYMYGFDEQAGNFQENNFSNGGSGGDSVEAHAQDGSGSCNARFTTPSDGSNPKMEMFTCNSTTPDRDGSLDSGIIVHEYGHGITNRLVGGPSNVSCLQNNQQPGEGWSDFFALAYTAKEGDQGTDSRGIGTYLFGQAADGIGIRTQYYSTDQNVNNFTYKSIAGMAVPHGVGSVWAQALWEVYWALVDKHGFDQDLRTPEPGWAGNQRALFYVTEGLKHTNCSPSFLDTRDGIIAAVVDTQDKFGTEDFCTVWQAFADFGLGVDAATPGNTATTATNGFSVPVECQCSPWAVANGGPDQNICLNQSVTIGTPAQLNNSYSWSPGGQSSAEITIIPAATQTYTLTATTSCGSATDQVTVFVDDGSTPVGLNQDFEDDISVGEWTATGLWHHVNNSACASPGYSSATKAFAFTQDASCNYNSGSTSTGTLTSPAISGISATSTLTFDYFRQVESYSGGAYDKTEVEIVTAAGSTMVWSRDSTDASSNAWTTSESIDLSSYEGQTIQIRFLFNSVDKVSNNYKGWFIDDVVVTGKSACDGIGAPEPNVVINTPANDTAFTEGDTITFSGTATDFDDGDLSAQIAWSFTTEGSAAGPVVLGASPGASVSSILPLGTHTVTATVTDTDSNTSFTSIIVTVNPNNPPSIEITAPSGGLTYTEGDTITFAATASDTEDGPLPQGTIIWSSSLEGASIGSGSPLALTTLSVGEHTITASVTDSGGKSTSSAPITVTVTLNSPPSIAITAPSSGLTYTEGDTITFAATASDTEDGPLPQGTIIWSSSLEGASIGSGSPLALTTLSVGEHTITASVTDSGGKSTSSAPITVTVTLNSPPSIAITAPSSGLTYTEGDTITFAATASDTEDGPLPQGTIIWSSSLEDASIGSGSPLALTTLSVGEHTITASVTDSGGKSTSSAPITVTVTLNSPPSIAITAPSGGLTYTEGDTITFAATASDTEDGPLPQGTIIWSSSLEGASIGSGSPLALTTLSVGEHTITASVTDSGGKSTSSTAITVTVNSITPVACDFTEDFEGDISAWSATGLWHLADDSTCTSPAAGYSSATKAFAYTQDASCNYNSGSTNSGTLTSPVISGISATSALTFDYFRQVESYSGGSYDKTEIEIITAAGSTVVWSRDSRNASTAAWAPSETIDLSSYAGQSIQVNFRFNSVDRVGNKFKGWFIDDVKVTDQSTCN